MSDTSPPDITSHAATANTPQKCRNCDHPATDNYCSSCGQSTQLELDLRTLFLGNAPKSHWTQSPWVRTILMLFIYPGKVTREFCDGKRLKYVHPLKYCLIMSAIGLVMLNVSQTRDLLLPKDEGDVPPEMMLALEWVTNLVIDHMGLMTVVTLPLLATFLKLLFKKHQLSFSHTMVLCLYVYGHSYLLQDIPTALGALNSNIGSTLINVIPFIIISIGAVQLYPEPAWKAVAKATLAHLLYYLVLAILVIVFAMVATITLQLLGR